MRNSLVRLHDYPRTTAHVVLEQEIDLAKAFIQEQHAASTRASYQSDWKIFSTWCRERGLKPLPAEPGLIATFLGSQACQGLKSSTIERRIAAIRYYHIMAGITEPPTNSELVKATMRGIRRSLGVQKDYKTPATTDIVLLLLEQIPDTLPGLRDRAMLLLGFAGALRRSELVALKVRDLEWVPRGMRVHIRKSKTDQEGEGQTIPIIRGKQNCPLQAVQDWFKVAGIKKGFVFRRIFKGGKVSQKGMTSHGFVFNLKKYADGAGLDPRQFSGHSLRSGFLTSAAMNGASIFKMMDCSVTVTT